MAEKNIESTNNVSENEITVDSATLDEQYYKSAVDAFKSGNNAETEKYCNKMIENNPDHFVAWLLKGKACGWQSTLNNDRIKEALECFKKAIETSPQDALKTVRDDSTQTVKELLINFLKKACDNYINIPSQQNATIIIKLLKKLNEYLNFVLVEFSSANSAPTGSTTNNDALQKLQILNNNIESDSKMLSDYNSFWSEVLTKLDNTTQQAWNNKIWPDYCNAATPGNNGYDRFIEQTSMFMSVIEATIVASKFSIDEKTRNIARYKFLISIKTKFTDVFTEEMNTIGITEASYDKTNSYIQARIDEIMGYHKKIQEIDPSYTIPNRPQSKLLAKKNSGCYVATAIYGSYDCPQVWTLRRYRDYDLAQKWYGRAFIHSYYAISPIIVKWFGHMNWFKKMWKGKLDRMVKKLQDKGYESTPYEDKNW